MSIRMKIYENIQKNKSFLFFADVSIFIFNFFFLQFSIKVGSRYIRAKLHDLTICSSDFRMGGQKCKIIWPCKISWPRSPCKIGLKYLSNFWRILDMSLINCKVSLILTWSRECVITSMERRVITNT